MKATPLKQYYEYNNTLLSRTCVEVTGIVIIKDNQVYATDGNIRVKVSENKSFTFSLNQPGKDGSYKPENTTEPNSWDAPLKNSSNVPDGISADAVIDEFKQFVIEDINSATQEE